jgi:hypothetical protein
MNYPRAASLTTLAIMCAGVTVAPGMGQTMLPPSARPSRQITAPRTSWTPPRTPWGDPDLSGTLTNKDEQFVPFERPVAFADRQRLTDDELAEREARLHQELETDNLFAGPVSAGRATSMVVDPPDGRIPPLTSEGRQRVADRAAARIQARIGRGLTDSYEDFSLYTRCITRGLPGSMLPALYGNSYQIVQGQGYVAIRYETVNEVRIIPLDARPHVGGGIREYMGDARGHWEGTTLVVETTNFKEEIAYRGGSPALRLVERFTRIAPQTIAWSVTIDDPRTWTRPWTFAMNLTRDEREPIFEYACHEGNYGLRDTLSTARAVEKNAGER